MAHYFVVSLVRSRAVGLTTAWSRASLTPRTASKRVSPINVEMDYWLAEFPPADFLEPIHDLPPSRKCYVFGYKTSSRANRNCITLRAPTCFSLKNLHFRDGYREIVDMLLWNYRIMWTNVKKKLFLLTR